MEKIKEEDLKKIEPEKKKKPEDKATMNQSRNPFDMEPPLDDAVFQPPENADPYYRSLYEEAANSLEDDDDDDKLNPFSKIFSLFKQCIPAFFI